MEKEKQKIVIQKKKYVPKEKSLKQEKPELPVEKNQEEDLENLELLTEIAKEAEKELKQEESEELLLGAEIQEEAKRLLELEEEPPAEEKPEENTSTEDVSGGEKKPLEKVEGPTFVRIVQKAPSRYRLLFSDGSTKWIHKKDFNF